MNDPVAAWRALQAEVPDSAAWVESVMSAQQDAGFVYHGKAMLEVAEPTFVTASQVAADQRAAEAVVAALVAAGRLLLDDRDLQNTYIPGWLDGVPDADLFSLPSGYSQPIVFGRLDGVRTSEGLHFLEFNGGLPGGILPADRSADLLADTDLAGRFGQQHPFRTATVGEDVLDALIDTWHDFGGGGPPYTVVAMPRELTDIATPALTYLSGLAQARGLEIAIADPGDTIILSWGTSGATQVTLWWLVPTGQLGEFWEVPLNGSFTYTIRDTERNATNFMLTATNAAGNHTNVTLAVTLRCTGEWFIANPPDICPYNPPLASQAAEQPFENGFMIWIAELDQIVVLFADGLSPHYAIFTDEWNEGDPEIDPTLEPPPGLYQPVRGFGLVWREGYGDVRSRLGWATQPEQAYSTLYQQTSYWKYNETYIRALNGGVWYLKAERSGWEWVVG